jgi:hypothetical protein
MELDKSLSITKPDLLRSDSWPWDGMYLAHLLAWEAIPWSCADSRNPDTGHGVTVLVERRINEG